LPFFLDTDGFIAPVAVSPPWPFPPYSPLRVGVASSRGDGGVCGAAISISANFFQSWGEGDGGGDKREGARRGAAPRGLAAGEGNGRRGGDVVGPPGTLPARCHVGAATPGARLSSGDPVPTGGCGWQVIMDWRLLREIERDWWRRDSGSHRHRM
jgi:hypothetical protein